MSWLWQLRRDRDVGYRGFRTGRNESSKNHRTIDTSTIRNPTSIYVVFELLRHPSSFILHTFQPVETVGVQTSDTGGCSLLYGRNPISQQAEDLDF